MTVSRSVTIITERSPDALATGVRRRLEHHLASLRSAGVELHAAHVYDGEPVPLRRTIAQARSVATEAIVQRGSRALVVGLGDVGLMVIADRLARTGTDVVFDQCDSMLLQLVAAIRSRRLKDAMWGALRIVVRRRMSPAVGFSYISRRDRRWDAMLNAGRRSAVVPANVDPALLELDEVRLAGITRISVPADFSSPHLSKGLGMLWEAVGERTPVALDLFGPAAPSVPLPPEVRYRGFARDIGDVYEGDTAVFIANVGGAGVPNKLLEAASARRPVIVHPSVRRRVDVEVFGWTYRSGADIARVLASIAEGASPKVL